MATKLSPFIICISLALLCSSALCIVHSTDSPGIDHWCSKTPYPGACKTTLTQNQYSIPKDMSDFKNLAIQATMETALKAESQIKTLGHKYRTGKEKAAWSDCNKLYQETIRLLKKTFDPSANHTEFDSQTWLSAALTNLETCRTGFVELGISDIVLPSISNNVAKLINNILSLSNGSTTPALTNQDTNGFPAWVNAAGVRRLLQFPPPAVLVVAQDGSGNFKTIKAALDVARTVSTGTNRIVIYVKKGVYKENLDINLKYIYLLGEGRRSTIITGDRSVKGGKYSTFNTATVCVTGEGFMARGITFRNTAGPENHQAVALRCGADFAVFYRCGFEGYQDTLNTHSNRQFYKDCDIYGTVDFIFGNGIAVFQNCRIYARKPMKGQEITITAQGRIYPNQNTGIVIQYSWVLPAPDLIPVINSVKTYLGRPWKKYSRTVFSQNYLAGHIDPAGWLEWDDNYALDTLYYGEYRNFGPGSGTSRRVKWNGYRVITSLSEASRFTVNNFLAGSSWIPATGVAFIPGFPGF